MVVGMKEVLCVLQKLFMFLYSITSSSHFAPVKGIEYNFLTSIYLLHIIAQMFYFLL
jgi:hypothetical protein